LQSDTKSSTSFKEPIETVKWLSRTIGTT